MLNTVVTISSNLLAPEAAQRFALLFEVAARKSLQRWNLVQHAWDHADVLVLDAQHANDERVERAQCVICIGAQTHLPVPSTAWVSWLSPQYTVGDLIGALDRAGIFLNDQKSQSHKAIAESVRRVGAAQNTYRITSWVVLPAPLDTPGCLRAMAVLSRGAVSLEKLCQHCQLEPALAQQLLQQLAQRGLLTVLERTGGAPLTADRARAPEGLLQRFSRWVLMGGRA